MGAFSSFSLYFHLTVLVATPSLLIAWHIFKTYSRQINQDETTSPYYTKVEISELTNSETNLRHVIEEAFNNNIIP